MTRSTFEAIGTAWTIDISDPVACTSEKLFTQIRERIEAFDKNYSRFRSDSLIYAMSHEAGTYQLPDDAEPLFDLYRDLYAATRGKLTPLIGQVLSDAGYDATYSREARDMHIPPTWDEVLDYSFPRLTLKRPALLDLGALGKGYLVDLIAEHIEDAGVEEYIVDAGGDMRIRTHEPVTVGLEHPEDPTSVLGIASITTGSICGSAGNRRVWKNSDGKEFHHVIDPDMLSSPRTVRAVWVTAPEARIADALTTCLYVHPLQTILPRLHAYAFEYFIVYSDYSIDISQGFPAEVFMDDPRSSSTL